MHKLARFTLGILAVGATLTVGALIEARVGMRLRRHQIAVLPKGARDIRVLHISDFHFLPSMRTKMRWVRSLADLNPDLVVNTGDNLSSPHALTTAMDALSPLLQVPGVFVYGSNDYWAPTWKNPLRYLVFQCRTRQSVGINTASTPIGVLAQDEEAQRVPLPHETFAKCLRAHGWLDLRNTSIATQINGTPITFIGVDDPHIGYDELPAPAAPPTAGIRIGVAHAPYQRTLNDFATLGVAVTFAGHTHGGQVNLPGYGALVTNCDLPSWRASGLQGWPGELPAPQGRAPVIPWRRLRPLPKRLGQSRMWVNISAGLGTSPFAPIRLFCRPEATLLTLTARDAE